MNDPNGPAPMEVDRLKGKDKGKGKTKDAKGSKERARRTRANPRAKVERPTLGRKEMEKVKVGKRRAKAKGPVKHVGLADVQDTSPRIAGVSDRLRPQLPTHLRAHRRYHQVLRRRSSQAVRQL